ncbi:hypothetical protein LXL04_034708 [Taraxacum kok-saghyz]
MPQSLKVYGVLRPLCRSKSQSMNEKFGLGRIAQLKINQTQLMNWLVKFRVDPVYVRGWTGGSAKPGRVDPSSYLGLTRSQLARSLLRVPVRPAGSTQGFTERFDQLKFLIPLYHVACFNCFDGGLARSTYWRNYTIIGKMGNKFGRSWDTKFALAFSW